MSSGLESALLERLASMEQRLSHLETLEPAHNIAGVSCGASQLLVRKVVTDNSATSVFTVTTANETGDNDAGIWAAYVYAICSNGAHGVTSIYAASKAFMGVVTRAQEGTGTGVCSVVTEAVETASAATSAGNRDVGTVTMTTTETSEYVTAVQFLVDGTGTTSTATSVYVTAYVVLVWTTFTTPPVLAAA